MTTAWYKSPKLFVAEMQRDKELMDDFHKESDKCIVNQKLEIEEPERRFGRMDWTKKRVTTNTQRKCALEKPPDGFLPIKAYKEVKSNKQARTTAPTSTPT